MNENKETTNVSSIKEELFDLMYHGATITPTPDFLCKSLDEKEITINVTRKQIQDTCSEYRRPYLNRHDAKANYHQRIENEDLHVMYNYSTFLLRYIAALIYSPQQNEVYDVDEIKKASSLLTKAFKKDPNLLSEKYLLEDESFTTFIQKNILDIADKLSSDKNSQTKIKINDSIQTVPNPNEIVSLDLYSTAYKLRKLPENSQLERLIEDKRKENINTIHSKAKEGDAIKQTQLGFCLENEIGCKKNIESAIEWYEKASEQNNFAKARLRELQPEKAETKVMEYTS